MNETNTKMSTNGSNAPDGETTTQLVQRREYLKAAGAVSGVGLLGTGISGAEPGEGGDDQRRPPQPTELRAEHEREPTNLHPGDERPPRLSWNVPAEPRPVEQSAYHVLVARDPSSLMPDEDPLWDSGTVGSSHSTTVDYAGPSLEPDTTYHWTVRIWNRDDEPSAWSEPGSFTTALSSGHDSWDGEWIGIEPESTASITNTAQNYPAALHEVETLGQTFTIDGSFERVSGRFPTWQASDSSVTLSLYETGPDGTQIASQRFTNIQDNAWIALEFDEALPAGTYYLEQSDADGTVGWWSHSDDVFPNGQAYEDGEPVDGDRTVRVGQADDSDPSPLLRRSFDLDGVVQSARAHVVTVGYGELHVNGERIGQEELNPAWTDYADRVLYSTHELTEHLDEGVNAVGIWLGRGWFSKGNSELPSRIPSWEALGPPRGLLQLNITYADGTTDRVTTDREWTRARSPITENDIYDGETYDAREEKTGWATADFDDGHWQPAAIVEPPSDDFAFHPQRLPPIRVTETLSPVSIEEREDSYLVDFGQNHAGWTEIDVEGAEAGDAITLEHAEVLDEEGRIVTENLRSAEATDTYVASGPEAVTYEPRFTYHGFRYVRVSGYPGDLTADDVRSKVVHTDFDRTGSFACSNDELDAVQHNAVWGLRSNAMGHPTDCCQRDERFGWTGDVHQNARADLFNFDAVRYHEKWMRDHDDDQDPDGSQSDAIPHAVDFGHADPNWAKTRVLVPWYLYLHTGDERILRDRYEGMKAYVDFWDRNAEDHVVPSSMTNYGDWLAFESPRSDPALFNTFAHYQTTDRFAQMAEVLDRGGDATVYRERASAIATAFNDEFFDRDAERYGSGTQTTYALPLSIGIVPAAHQQTVVENLVTKIRTEDDGKLQTGFIGTRPLLNSLVEYGYGDLAYHVVSQPEQPGWVYMVRNGATTMWERWDSDEQIGSGMNSFNHRPWTLVSEWFYRYLAGIDAAEPGFERVSITPKPIGDLTWASATTETVRGTVSSRWQLAESNGKRSGPSGMRLEVTIPGNATGTIEVPTFGAEKVRLREHGKPIWNNGNRTRPNHAGVKTVTRDGDVVVAEVGSGEYTFELERIGV